MQETILPHNHPPLFNLPGGNAAYASAGISIWDSGVSLLSRVGSNYSLEWLANFETYGWDLTGVKQLTIPLDHRNLYAYEEQELISTRNPFDIFTTAGLPFPKELIGYQDNSTSMDSRNQPTLITLKASDLPANYLDATAAHICPMDFLTHALLPPIFRQGHISTITIEPGAGYMHPTFFDDIPNLLGRITAFLPSEINARNLFHGRTSDLNEICDSLASLGCEIVVIQRESRGCLVFDHASRSRWIIPAYPSQVVDPTGANDAFSGGFLAGFRQTYDPLEAALHATVSRSFCVEGSGPKFMLDTMPRLARARLESLRYLVRKL